MIDYYKILVRTGDGRDKYEPVPLHKMNNLTHFQDTDTVLQLAYELFEYAETRKVTIEEYEDDKLIREIEMFANTRRL